MASLNLVFVIFDSARRDRFGCYGYGRPTTPAVNALASEGLVFDQMITPAPWTVPSHGSLFTGLYPREHGGQWPVPLVRKDCIRLAQHLQAHGYATACVSANPLLTRGGLNEGFQIALARKDLNGSVLRRRLRFVLGLHDSGSAAVTSRAAQLMGGALRPPFFVMLNFMECHWPYFPPVRFLQRFLPGSHTWLRAAWHRMRDREQQAWESIAVADDEQLAVLQGMYDAALATVDDRFGFLLEALRQSRHVDDTVVVVAADHGENIGDHGLATHQGSLHRTLIHVPFIARIPGRSPARISGLVQFTDVFAGVCRLLGLEPPAEVRERPMGVDPFNLHDGEPGRPYAFAEWRHWGREPVRRMQRQSPHFDFSMIPDGLEVAQDRRFKLVVRQDTGDAALYDLDVDPDETHNVAGLYPEQVARLRRALQDWHTQFPAVTMTAAYTSEEVAAVETRLRELGYL